MAGHSQFKNIMHRKGAQDARRGKLFTKLIREIMASARIGLPDPAANTRLRSAITAARQANMPRDTIERAVKRGAGGDDGAQYEEVRYEGYGPGGVALIIEVLTDNRNRTAAEIRAALTKYGGNLGETNSVSFMFERLGSIIYPAKAASADAVFEAALEAGARDVESTADSHDVTCAPEDFAALGEALEKTFGAPAQAALVWRPQTMVPLDEEAAQSVLKLIDVLDDNDDVRSVFANFEVSDDVMRRLSA